MMEFSSENYHLHRHWSKMAYLIPQTQLTGRYSYITLDSLYFNAVAYENSIPCFTHWIIQKMYGSGISSNSNSGNE